MKKRIDDCEQGTLVSLGNDLYVVNSESGRGIEVVRVGYLNILGGYSLFCKGYDSFMPFETIVDTMQVVRA